MYGVKAKSIGEPKRLLAVNLNYLGDALFTTPALAALRGRFPAARIDVLAGERAAAILGGSADIDSLLVRPPRGGSSRNAFLFRTLRAGRYDTVVLFQSILSYAALAFAAGVPVRVGFAQDGAGPFLTHPVAPRQAGEHVVSAYARLAAAFGPVPEGSLRLRVAISPEDRLFAERFIQDHEVVAPIAGLVIGATRPQKRWPEEYFAALADRLWNTKGIASILLGGPEESEAAGRIQARARSPIVSAVGRTNEKQLAGLVARCDVIVSGDSGPLHIATAVETPVVALFGSTDPAETGPWNGVPGAAVRGVVLYDAFACAPCRKAPTCHGRFDCLRALTPERVFDAVTGVLGMTTRKSLPVTASRGLV
jgi:lipopolysaccharide heptosyltransferase II